MKGNKTRVWHVTCQGVLLQPPADDIKSNGINNWIFFDCESGTIDDPTSSTPTCSSFQRGTRIALLIPHQFVWLQKTINMCPLWGCVCVIYCKRKSRGSQWGDQGWGFSTMLSLGFLSVFYIFSLAFTYFLAQCALEMNLTRQTWLIVTSKAFLIAAAVKLDLSLEVSAKRVIILTK